MTIVDTRSAPSRATFAPPIPLVSVVMPSFNQAQFIDESIRSVLEQSYARIELIIADGGSSDGTVEKLAAWRSRDQRVRYVSEPDRGPADAVNKALRMGRGTIIGWLNSDDLYTSGAVQRSVEALVDAPGLVAVYGQGDHVDEAGKWLSRYPTLPPTTPIAHFGQGCFICQPTVFFTRTLLMLVGNLDVTFKTAFDFDYWMRVFRAVPGRIGFINEVQAQSRLHASCITQKMRRQVALEGVKILHTYFGQAPIHWILTHMEEARQTREPRLLAYLLALLRDAQPYFSEPDRDALRHAAADMINRSKPAQTAKN